MKFAVRLSVCFVLSLVAASTRADEYETIRETIRQEIAGGLPSCAVAVAKNGQIVWEEGFGLADRESNRPATPETMYSLASISKPITATGLMLLVERGKVDLDRPINDYLGDVKLTAHVGDAAAATVRRVADHTSGLPLHYQFFYVDQPYRRPPMDETIRRYGHLVTAPGERFNYANLGYGLLDYVISRTSGQSYVDFMREEVFEPLGLSRMAVDIPAGMESYTATRYTPDGSPIAFYDFDHPGASAVFASARDLVRFGMFHLGDHASEKPILSQAAIAAMQTPGESPAQSGYAVGWRIDRDAAGRRTVSHTGGMGGVATILYLVPEEHLAVVVLCNARTGIPSQLAPRIADIAAPPQAKETTGDAPATTTAGGGSDADDEPRRREPVQLTGRWSGVVETYEGKLPMVLEFHGRRDVHVRLGNQLWTLVNRPRFRGGELTGVFNGDLGVEDANRTKHQLRLDLRLRGDDTLNGAVIALSVPAIRSGNALSFWTELHCEPEREEDGPDDE